MSGDIAMCLECCVCMERMTNPCTWMPCQHMACMACVAQTGSGCPICRQQASHICLPQHNRPVWQMCGQDRGTDALHEFMVMYDAVARFHRWQKRNDPRMMADRFFMVHRIPAHAVQQIRDVQKQQADHEARHATAQRVAKREKAHIGRCRLQLAEILTQYVGADVVP